MEWATNVNLFGGTATIKDGDGESTLLELPQLHNHGLPRTAKDQHTVRIQLDKGSSITEFPDDVGRLLCTPEKLWSTHGLYKWTIRGRDYMIPALTLMRTFFGPSGHLLAEMFRPQALERICYLDFDSTPPALQLVIRKVRPVEARAKAAVDQRLSWMLTYPTAHRMAGSIHRFGLLGRLDMTLPKAVAYVEVLGMPLADSFFVTRCRLMSLAPQEAPIAGVPATARFVMQKFRGHGCDVSRHANGSIKLTDAEWAQIYELTDMCKLLLASPSSRARLDAILDKLAEETAWTNVAYIGVPAYTLIALHRALTKNFLLEKILIFLEESRRPSATEAPDNVCNSDAWQRN